MKQKKSNSKLAVAATIASGFGYLSCAMQWLWAAALLGPVALENDMIYNFFIPDQTQTEFNTPSIAFEPSSFVVTIVGISITVLVLIISVIILIRLPSTITKIGNTTVHKTATAALPVVTHHKKLPESVRTSIITRLEKYIKFALCIIPFGLLNLVYFLDTAISNEITIFVGAILAIASLFWFSLQYLLEKYAPTSTA